MDTNAMNRSPKKRRTLQEEIERIAARTVPMHMPGHKRGLRPSDALPYELDITEIDGADDLHDASGILAEAMERAADLWGSRRTWLLVGGSTCGLLAAIRAAAPFGSEIIAARNCHRSVFHAIELGGYKVHWIVPEQNREYEICKAITPEQVAAAVNRHPGSSAVVLTSPTYEGIISDIRGISGICTKAGIPLIVDEAHGAHLGLFGEDGFPDGAVKCGADLVVQSLHKTLPSLTQTAVLHLQGNLVGEREIERQLGIFETSSPSYPLMISIDSCVGLLRKEGKELFGRWKENLDRFYRDTESFGSIRVFNEDSRREKNNEPLVRDRSKILISFRNGNMRGSRAAQILRSRYGIETEMSSGMNVLAMTGPGDSRENFTRLFEALRSMDIVLCSGGEEELRRREPLELPKVRTACSILKAVEHPREMLPLRECIGRICGEYLYAYPPGIPILAPGEYITAQHLKAILRTESDGNRIYHTHSDDRKMIACLEE